MKTSINKYRYKRRVILSVIGILCMIGLLACKTKNDNTREDILTLKTIESGRTPITVLVKYAFSINSFERAVEEKFPNIDIIQVGNYTRDMGIAEYERRLEHDDLTDIVMTWPLDVGEEYWEERLLDLSGFDFTNKYKLSMLNEIDRNGKLYYLPGPAQVRGILYNETLFEENNWEVPNNFDEFIELCKTIEKTGMRSIQLGFGNSEVLNTAFVGYNYGNYFSKPSDIQWIAEYNQGKGSFGEHFSGALDVFQKMIDEGIWRKSDLNITYSIREEMFFNRKCAMVEDSVLMARMGYEYNGTTDKYSLMPFFNPSEQSDWARLYMVCYVGLNKHLAEAKNREKYNLVMELMNYISTPEGQEALAADTGAMFSSLVDAEAPNLREIKSLTTALNFGRYAIFPQLKNAQSALEEGLARMVKGELRKEDVIEMVDMQNQNPIVTNVLERLGSAKENFTLIETGNFVTDAMRSWSNSDIALFLDNGKDGTYNGKGISGRLYEGDITDKDISCVLPDLKQGETGTLWEITMTGANLKKTLEHTISITNNKGWFYYFSGIKMEYAPDAEPGNRIKMIQMEDGKPLEDTKIYSIAVMDETVPEESIIDCVKTDITIASILERTIKAAQAISPSKDGRFIIAPFSKNE